MISPELIRRYPFFAGFSMEEIQILAMAGEELNVKQDHVFFRGNDTLDRFYLIMDGAVGILLEPPLRDVKHGVVEQLTGQMQTEDVIVSTIAQGDVFGWSALLPPFKATAGAKALGATRVIAFDAIELLHVFDENPHFGYRMVQRLAYVIHRRLYDRQIESLAQHMVLPAEG